MGDGRIFCFGTSKKLFAIRNTKSRCIGPSIHLQILDFSKVGKTIIYINPTLTKNQPSIFDMGRKDTDRGVAFVNAFNQELRGA